MHTATTKRVWVPKRKHFAFFIDRDKLRVGHPTRSFKLSGAYPPVSLPIDWTKGDTLSFPIDGNDTYGCCMYAAGCHADNTFTGNVGVESKFNEATIISDYLALSGGDNGLDESQLVGAWEAGLASTPAAVIYDSLDIDPTDAAAMQAAIYFFGCVVFMLSVPDNWIQEFETGTIWDAPAKADPENGHGILWNGVTNAGNVAGAVTAAGDYKLQTWGTYGFITPAGVAVCDPSAFVVFSPRWFDANGVAPNGQTYAQLAALWVQFGGKALPPFAPPAPSPTPTPTPNPTPTPTPAPAPATAMITIDPAAKVVASPAGLGITFVRAAGHAVTFNEGAKQIGLPGNWTGNQV